MSSYNELTPHPETGIVENAAWLDDYFGRHRYGVKFSDGKVFTPDQVQKAKPPEKRIKLRQLMIDFDYWSENKDR